MHGKKNKNESSFREQRKKELERKEEGEKQNVGRKRLSSSLRGNEQKTKNHDCQLLM